MKDVELSSDFRYFNYLSLHIKYLGGLILIVKSKNHLYHLIINFLSCRLLEFCCVEVQRLVSQCHRQLFAVI